MRVSLFATCLADQLFPQVAVATVKLLRHLGAEVAFPEGQTCCGQPAYNAGYHREARAVARHHIGVFGGADYVVLPSGSCGAMLGHYPDLFSEDGPAYAAARGLAERTFELTTFITEVLGQEDIGADLSGTRVTYHDSCHAMRFMGVREAPRRLLKAAGAELVEAEGSDVCCGFGGLFSVKMPEISAAMARAKLPGIHATGAAVLTSTDGGCLMQLSGTLRREGSSRGESDEAAKLEVIHIAELLWRGVERARAAA
ncbi:MAG: (Fe-S)-binding protein [Deinococcota bacterium]|nr:(Fe-S)-binding protein [Deinococcota bacterium]